MPLAYQLAEGATGTFFDTDLLLANPTAANVAVTVTYLTERGRVVTQGLTLAPQSRTTVSADANAQLGPAAFSATVTSHLGIPIAVERTLRWDATGYGMHTEKAPPALSRTWFFAEGAQGFYQTFFLLTNPSPAPNIATLRFLRENGIEVTRTFTLAPQSRLTVYAGDIPELVNQAFGTVVTFAFAGAAERAMYFGSPVFNGGHESAGATRPSTDWFLAEGATGSFFTTFVLLSNPNATPASVTHDLPPRGRRHRHAHEDDAGRRSRLTVNVALEDPPLAATSVATRVTSDIPSSPSGRCTGRSTPASWQEAHNAFGVTETAQRWALAEGRVGGPFAFQTFVLVANPGTTAANLTLTFLRTTGAPITKTRDGAGRRPPDPHHRSRHDGAGAGQRVVRRRPGVGPARVRRARAVFERQQRVLGRGQRRDGHPDAVAPASLTARYRRASARTAGVTVLLSAGLPR